MRSLRKRSFSAALLVVVIAVGIYRIAYVSAYAPERNQRKSIAETLTPMQEIIQDGDQVFTLLSPRNYRLLYYLDVPVLRIESVKDMVAEVGEGERVHVLVMEEGKDSLEDLQPGRWSMVVSFPNKVGTGFLMSTVPRTKDH